MASEKKKSSGSTPSTGSGVGAPTHNQKKATEKKATTPSTSTKKTTTTKPKVINNAGFKDYIKQPKKSTDIPSIKNLPRPERPVMLAERKKVANVGGKEGARASVTAKRTKADERNRYQPKPTKAKATAKRKPAKRGGK